MLSLVPKAAQIPLSTAGLGRAVTHTIQSPMQKWAKQKGFSLGGTFNTDIIVPGRNTNHLWDFIKRKSETQVSLETCIRRKI